MALDAADTGRPPAVHGGRGLTPNEVARLLRVRPDRVRAWIATGQLGAINTAPRQYGRPRYVVLLHHLAEFERRRSAAAPPTPRRRKRTCAVDYFPDE
jgi:hypothetical protein